MEFLSLWQVLLNAYPKPSILMPVPTTISCGVKCSSWPLNHQSHIHVFIFHILLELTCKGSKFTRPQCEPVKQYFLFFWFKFISHKTSWDVCCSWTLPNLLYPDHLTSIIFHITFFSKQCLILLIGCTGSLLLLVGFLFIAVLGLLTAVASPVVEHRL